MKIKHITVILLLSVYSISSFAEKKNHSIIEYGYSSLEFAILNSVGIPNPPNDASGLLILLGDIDNDNARELLVKLTDYYLGSATTEALDYSIVRQGKKILFKLKKQLNNPNICDERNELRGDRCLTLKERNQKISRYIELIESGKTIDYVY